MLPATRPPAAAAGDRALGVLRHAEERVADVGEERDRVLGPVGHVLLDVPPARDGRELLQLRLLEPVGGLRAERTPPETKASPPPAAPPKPRG